MQPQPPSTALGPRRASLLDRRTIYLPVEIPHDFQTNYRSLDVSRPVISEVKRFQDRYVAETTSYFPKIRESAIARDTREKQLALVKQTRKIWKEGSVRPRQPFNTQHGVAAKTLSTLDQDGMAEIHSAFERHGRLNEQEFIAEFLYSLDAQNMGRKQQVSLTNELSSLYRRANINAAGHRTWEDFSSTIFKTSDELSLEEYTSSQWLTCQADALNMSSEQHGMYYFEGIDRVFLHDARKKGFRLLDTSNNNVVGEFNFPSRGVSILDAVYSPMGRYVITASTSPVIALYDVDQLRIRQQIPTEAAQTALELERNPATSRLYSACTNGQVHVWNLENLSCGHSFFSKGHEVMTDIAAIDNTSHLVTSCMDGKVYVLDLHLGSIGKALTGHDKGVAMLKYSSHNGYILSGGLDHNVNLWTPHVNQKIGSLQGHKHQLIGLEVVPDSPQVISADESGLIKIWDLRKYASVQTFKREFYVKDHTVSRTLTRPMRSMCYIQSRKRIAIAHSSIFFVGLEHEEEEDVPRIGTNRMKRMCDEVEQGMDVEERSRPIAVVLNRPSRSIVVVTLREFQSWAVDSGQLIHREKLSIRVDITCVSIVDDQHSCILGTEDGTVARTMLPRATVILSKRLHSAEVAAVRWVSGSRQVVSSSFDGTVLISDSANLQVIHTLSHWQGIQSMTNHYRNISERASSQAETLPQDPLKTLNDVEEFKNLFKSVDRAQTGKITARKADEILDRVFPLPNTARKSCSSRKVFADQESITLTAFVKIAQTRIKEMQQLGISGKGNGVLDAAMIDIHGQLQHLVTISPVEGTFCVWNLKNGTVIASCGVAGHTNTGPTRLNAALIHQVVYLDPYPYFVLVDEGHPSQLSIWSSKAISSVFPYGHQQILRYQYEVTLQNSQDCGEMLHNNTRGNAVLCSSLWISGDTNCSNLFCVGDDQGYVSIYNFDELFNEIEKLRKAPPSWQDSQAQHLNEDRLLPPTLVRIHSQWLVRDRDSIRTLCVIRDKSSLPLMAVTLDSGVTSFFTTEGQCVGNLADRTVPWQLSTCIGASEFDMSSNTTKILTKMKTQKRVTQTPRRRQSQEKQDLTRNSEPKTASITHDKTTEEYAKQRPGLSRFLAVANQL